MAQWSLTGNSGTTPGTNFVGTTTSGIGLMFKAGNVQSGYIDITNTNASFGYNALSSNSSGQNNTAFGTGAAALNTTGANNLAIGTYALVNNATASYNTAIGRQALQGCTSGTMNMGIGYQSLFSVVSGSYNTGYGFQTLYSTTGSNNTAAGYLAGFSTGSGGNNTFNGYEAGYDNSTGGSNTFVGANTGRGITTGSNNTVIGANVTSLAAALTNNIIIADGSGNRRINVDNNGNVGIGTTTPSAQLHTTGSVLFAGLTLNSSPTNVIVEDASGHIGYEPVSSFSGGGGGSSSWSTSGTGNIVNSNAGVVIIGAVPTTLFSDANLKLAVNGDIYSQKIVVTQTGWSDYVFDPGYKLSPLKEVAAFVAKNKHLPDVPTTADVEKNGIDLGANQSTLLKKVEELTLYAIEQDKKAEAQQKLIDDQYKLLMQMKDEIEQLKKQKN
jgi:hypothetical protein